MAKPHGSKVLFISISLKLPRSAYKPSIEEMTFCSLLCSVDFTYLGKGDWDCPVYVLAPSPLHIFDIVIPSLH